MKVFQKEVPPGNTIVFEPKIINNVLPPPSIPEKPKKKLERLLPFAPTLSFITAVGALIVSTCSYQKTAENYNRTVEQFNIANTPILTIEAVHFGPIRPDSGLSVKLAFRNLGPYTVKGEDYVFSVQENTALPKFDVVYRRDHPNRMVYNEYITQKSDTLENIYTEPLGDTRFENLRLNRKQLYVYGYFRYKSLADNRSRIFEFMIRCYPVLRVQENVLFENFCIDTLPDHPIHALTKEWIDGSKLR